MVGAVVHMMGDYLLVVGVNARKVSESNATLQS